MRFFTVFMMIFSTIFVVHASKLHSGVVELLHSPEEPEGIILDIESNDPNFWVNRYQFVQDQVDALKEKFPDTDLMILSHGRELKRLSEDDQLKKKVDNLLISVDLNVCSVASEWQGIDESNYQENVQTVVSAPAERNNYIELGYTVVYLERFTAEQMKQFLIDNQVVE